MAIIDISARVVGATRRLEVYGTKGTAIIVEPFEPGEQIKLILDADRGEYKEGEQMLDVGEKSQSAKVQRVLSVGRVHDSPCCVATRW